MRFGGLGAGRGLAVGSESLVRVAGDQVRLPHRKEGLGGAVIENNVIWDNEGWCMAIYHSDGATIRNNTCWQNGLGRG